MSIIHSEYWKSIQSSLFPRLSDFLEETLTDQHKRLASTIEFVRIESHVKSPVRCWTGRPRKELACMARAFVGKAVYNLGTTEALIECLRTDSNFRKICGWSFRRDVPSSATFSRSFARFTDAGLGDIVHRALVAEHVGDSIVMHKHLDSTEVDARERAVKKEPSLVVKVPRKRGRRKTGEAPPPPDPTRLDIQMGQTAEEALADLPKVCNWGSKKDSGGHVHSWKGWKAHVEWGDGNIPLNVVTTSASVHDSQAAIPMLRQTALRVISLYDLMDSAYDAWQIYEVSKDVGHVPLIDPNPRGSGVPEEKLFDPAMKERYKQRSTAERGNSRLKDQFGLRCLRVRGHAKAHMHIMFGIIALFADQMLKPCSA